MSQLGKAPDLETPNFISVSNGADKDPGKGFEIFVSSSVADLASTIEDETTKTRVKGHLA